MGKKTREEALITVKVIPRSSSQGVSLGQEGIWKARVSAPAVEGKANSALIDMLSKMLGIPKKGIEIVAGEKSRTKRIRLSGLDATSAERLLMGLEDGRRK